MTQKEIYEALGAVADTLNRPEREQFAALLEELTMSGSFTRWESARRTVRRWLRDGGFS